MSKPTWSKKNNVLILKRWYKCWFFLWYLPVKSSKVLACEFSFSVDQWNDFSGLLDFQFSLEFARYGFMCRELDQTETRFSCSQFVAKHFSMQLTCWLWEVLVAYWLKIEHVEIINTQYMDCPVQGSYLLLCTNIGIYFPSTIILQCIIQWKIYVICDIYILQTATKVSRKYMRTVSVFLN